MAAGISISQLPNVEQVKDEDYTILVQDNVTSRTYISSLANIFNNGTTVNLAIITNKVNALCANASTRYSNSQIDAKCNNAKQAAINTVNGNIQTLQTSFSELQSAVNGYKNITEQAESTLNSLTSLTNDPSTIDKLKSLIDAATSDDGEVTILNIAETINDINNNVEKAISDIEKTNSDLNYAEKFLNSIAKNQCSPIISANSLKNNFEGMFNYVLSSYKYCYDKNRFANAPGTEYVLTSMTATLSVGLSVDENGNAWELSIDKDDEDRLQYRFSETSFPGESTFSLDNAVPLRAGMFEMDDGLDLYTSIDGNSEVAIYAVPNTKFIDGYKTIVEVFVNDSKIARFKTENAIGNDTDLKLLLSQRLPFGTRINFHVKDEITAINDGNTKSLSSNLTTLSSQICENSLIGAVRSILLPSENELAIELLSAWNENNVTKVSYRTIGGKTENEYRGTLETNDNGSYGLNYPIRTDNSSFSFDAVENSIQGLIDSGTVVSIKVNDVHSNQVTVS